MATREVVEPPSNLGIDRETLAFVVLKARAYDVLAPPDDPDEASDAVDDRFVDVMEDEPESNAVAQELREAIMGLDADAQAALVALAWLGRGDYDEWKEAIRAARDRAELPTWRYLMGIPLLGDYIENGADRIGINLIEEEEDGLGDPDLDTRGG